MALTNAERQARHRERLKSAAALSGELTPQQVEDRRATMTRSLFPITAAAGGNAGSHFMGLGPNQWRKAPDELVDFFGMREACDKWNAEWQEHLRRVEEARKRADEIIASIGARAKKIAREHGNTALCRAYNIDPNLGSEAVKSVT